MAQFLFIDTAAAVATVALSKNGLVSALQHQEPTDQVSALPLLIEELLANAASSLKELDALCICAGPGSYTGLRVGLSAAKGIAFALDKPLMLFNRLDLLAAEALPDKALAVMLTARKGEYFFAHYAADRSLVVAPRHVFASELSQLLAPELTVLCDQPLPEELRNPSLPYDSSKGISVAHWLPLATARWEQADFDDTAYCEPFYLKAAYTTTPKPR